MKIWFCGSTEQGNSLKLVFQQMVMKPQKNQLNQISLDLPKCLHIVVWPFINDEKKKFITYKYHLQFSPFCSYFKKKHTGINQKACFFLFRTCVNL